MTFEQTAKILTLVQAEYPNSFGRLDERQLALKLELWAREFEGDEYAVVYAAVRALMRSNSAFAPNIGAIREKMFQLSQPDELDEAAAWALVTKAASNGLYGSEKEFEALPPDVQAAVGSPRQLKEWAMLDVQEFQTVIGSNFRRSLRAERQRAKERAALPGTVLELIDGMADKMILPQEVES